LLSLSSHDAAAAAAAAAAQSDEDTDDDEDDAAFERYKQERIAFVQNSLSVQIQRHSDQEFGTVRGASGCASLRIE